MNTLIPDPIDTPMIRNGAGSKEASEKLINSIISDSIMGRIGNPSEIGKVAVFLTSDKIVRTDDYFEDENIMTKSDRILIK